MNRTSEYVKFISNKNNSSFEFKRKERFYDSIYNKICKLQHTLLRQQKYIDILVIEENYNNILKDTKTLLNMLEIDTNDDERIFFEGVQKIINLKLNELKNTIKSKKKDSMSLKIELQPEKPKNVAPRNSKYDQLMEEENRKLVERLVDTSIQKTRKRVAEIQSIQNLIGIHIAAHDERIDNIELDTKKSLKNVKLTNKFVGKNGGKMARRILFLFLICISFVLLFLHFYYKNNF